MAKEVVTILAGIIGLISAQGGHMVSRNLEQSAAAKKEAQEKLEEMCLRVMKNAREGKIDEGLNDELELNEKGTIRQLLHAHLTNPSDESLPLLWAQIKRELSEGRREYEHSQKFKYALRGATYTSIVIVVIIAAAGIVWAFDEYVINKPNKPSVSSISLQHKNGKVLSSAVSGPTPLRSPEPARIESRNLDPKEVTSVKKLYECLKAKNNLCHKGSVVDDILDDLHDPLSVAGKTKEEIQDILKCPKTKNILIGAAQKAANKTASESTRSLISDIDKIGEVARGPVCRGVDQLPDARKSSDLAGLSVLPPPSPKAP